jgi:hypothetical protein
MTPVMTAQSDKGVHHPPMKVRANSESKEYVPSYYDIVSRGQMPAIVFHNDAVELVYQVSVTAELV